MQRSITCPNCQARFSLAADHAAATAACPACWHRQPLPDEPGPPPAVESPEVVAAGAVDGGGAADPPRQPIEPQPVEPEEEPKEGQPEEDPPEEVLQEEPEEEEEEEEEELPEFSPEELLRALDSVGSGPAEVAEKPAAASDLDTEIHFGDTNVPPPVEEPEAAAEPAEVEYILLEPEAPPRPIIDLPPVPEPPPAAPEPPPPPPPPPRTTGPIPRQTVKKESKTRQTKALREPGSWRPGRGGGSTSTAAGPLRKLLLVLTPLVIVCLVIWIPRCGGPAGKDLGPMPEPERDIEFVGKIEARRSGFFFATEPRGCYVHTRTGIRIWLVVDQPKLKEIKADLPRPNSIVWVAGRGALYRTDDVRLIPAHREADRVIVLDAASFRHVSEQEYEELPSGFD